MRVKLTDRFAASAPAGLFWDTDPRSPAGFGLRVTTALSRSWFLNYRRRSDGVERRPTIGSASAWPIARARERAAELRRVVDAGGDPLAEAEARRDAPTVGDLWARFEKEALPARAERTAAEYKAMARDWILPALAKSKVASIERDDIEKLHRKITVEGKARRANAVKSLCSTLFVQAVIWKMRDDNPTQHIKGNREDVRERFLSGEELDRLLAVLEDYREKRPDSVDAITLAALTGSRRGEILGMRWRDLDLPNALWVKPPELVKKMRGRSHRLTLSPEAVAVLSRRQAERDAQASERVVRLRRNDRDDFVFTGGGSKTHTNRFEGDWREIRAAAGL
jgi:integrase